MKPCYELSQAEHEDLFAALSDIGENPYTDYVAFSSAICAVRNRGAVPASFVEVCRRIRDDRASGVSNAHVLRNCPIDAEIPTLGHEDPVTDKLAKKKTFVGEALLELTGQLLGTPLLAYARNRGDFFTDVIAIDKYSGHLTGYSDSELYFHNDRTAHPIRADYIALLGLRCPEDDTIYTGFIEGRTLLENLTADERSFLRQPWYITPFDVFSKDKDRALTTSEVHPILEGDHDFRYLDTATTTAPSSPPLAKDGLLSMKTAIVKAHKKRHRILTKDLFLLANTGGLHSREKIEIHDSERAKSRWLLKTYAFRDATAADRHAGKWLGNVRGRVAG